MQLIEKEDMMPCNIYPVLYGFVVFLITSVTISTGSIRHLTNVNFDLRGRTSGVAVVDINQNGGFEVIVAVLEGANLVIQYNHETGMFDDVTRVDPHYKILQDPQAKTVSVSACDIDGDGREEVYLHNVNGVYSNAASYVTPDRLIRKTGSRYKDVFDDPSNRDLAPRTAGTSVSCVDVRGDGKYAFFVTTVTDDGKGVYKMFAVNTTQDGSETNGRTIALAEISRATNVGIVKDGRGISIGPIVGDDGSSDIFVTNDNSYYVGSATYRHGGGNVLFRNNGNGTFTDVSNEFGLLDADENGRGSAVGDFTGDQNVDIIYVNWLGPGRLIEVRRRENKTDDRGQTPTIFGAAGPSTVLLTCDLDNDGRTEVVRGNTDPESFYPTENLLLTILQDNTTASGVGFEPFYHGNNDIPSLHITGISVADLNGNGRLELYMSHRPFNGRTFSIYEHSSTDNGWIRILPLTKHGAPARGSKLTLTLTDGDQRVAVIGGGCGYMCQMEPFAHFGLGKGTAREVTVIWPDGHSIRKFLYDRHQRKAFSMSYTGQVKVASQGQSSDIDISSANRTSPGRFIISLFLVVLNFIFTLANRGISL